MIAYTNDVKIKTLMLKAEDIIRNTYIPVNTDVTISSDLEYKIKFHKNLNADTLGCCCTNNIHTIIYIRSGMSDKNTLETILHELIHTCDGCFNHGKLFRLYSDAVNSYVRSNFDEFSEFSCGFHESKIDDSAYLKKFKYVVTCPKCNLKTYYARNCKSFKDILLSFTKNIESNYKCCKCGCTRLKAEKIHA